MKAKSQLLGGLVLACVLAVGAASLSQDTEVVQDSSIVDSASQMAPLPITGRDVASFSSLSEAQLAALTSELDAAPLIPFAALAPDEIYGNFFSLQNPDWPPLPADLSASSVWKISGPNNAFLLNDINFDYQAASRKVLARGGMQPMELSVEAPDFGTNLYLAQVSLAAGYLTGIASNTLADVSYEIMTNSDLTTTNWGSSGLFIFGSETTNWTALGNLPVSLTNNMFFRLRSWEDDGSGLPIWWQMAFFGVASGVDPYDDPAGDGWNNLQKLHNGWNPNLFYTPPAPQGVTVHYNAGSGAATVSWQPSPGPVTGYVVKDSSGTTTNLSATTTSWQKNVPNIPNGGNGDPTVYKSFQVQAQYAGGNSAQSELVPLEQITVSGRFAFGSGNSTYLSVSALPANAATLRLIQVEVDANALGDYSLNSTHEISVSMLTNGSVLIPTNWLPPIQAAQAAYGTANFNWWLQASNTDASASAGTFAWGDYYPAAGDALAIPYFDGRAQLKQNLIFLLRSGLDIPVNISGFDSNDVWSQLEYDLPTNNYAHADFYDYSGSNYFPQQVFDEFLPFEQNYFYRNFVFNLTETDPNGLLASFDTSFTDHASRRNDFIALGLLEPPPFRFQPPATSGATIASLLATNQTRWLFMSQPDFVDDLGNSPIGMVNLEGTNYLAADFRNRFGLEFLSTKMAWGNSNPETSILYPGEGTTLGGWFYSETAQPQFSTVEYDFFSPYGIWDEATQTRIDPTMPGLPSFSPTNQSQLFIVSPGQGTRIAGYAKLAVVNGYSGVYGYLGQYFDQAYKITNGIVTTNTTGFLSPYGDFVATEPGPAALLTMPDLDTGERGTCTVYCVSLQLDKNGDGVLDMSFNGPDATSQASPMKFWVNNDHDWSDYIGDVGKDVQSTADYSDYTFQNIPSQRDLEDWARLWICGVPALTNAGYEVSLSWNVSSGSPAVNLVQSVETDGGTLYLTDTNIAAAQTSGSTSSDPSYKFARVTPGQAYTFPASYFTNSGNKYLLFEGAGIGSGELVLTISQNGNVIAQTGLWLDLHDVKDFYERAVITNNMSGAKSNWTSTVQVVQPAVSSALDSDTNLIVLVHGINVTARDCLQQGDTVFKRLYWAGFQGKFATVKWPCNLLTPIPDPLSPAVFNDSELQGYKASTALIAYLDGLHSRFPNYRLNILAHSQGNTVVSEAVKNGLTFDTYILTQGALPDSAYDVDAPVDTDLTSQEHGEYITPEWQPMGYRGVYTNSNFAGRVVNFYNPLDKVLGYWVNDQKLLKPTSYLSTAHYYYDGTDSYFYPALADPYLVTDPEESRADVSRSRTLSIGQSGPASAHGVIKSAVNLNTQFGFNGDTTDEHSAQWTRPIQTCLPYYNQVLIQIKPLQ